MSVVTAAAAAAAATATAATATANLNNVVISITEVSKVVTLIVNWDPTDRMKYRADTLIAQFGIKVLNNKGKPPRGGNMQWWHA
jgi:hypothetical protein